jgi:Spy/CpxP family protein refolding chaperone
MTQENIPPQGDINLQTDVKKKNPKKRRIIWGAVIIIFLITGIAGIGFAQKVKKMRDNGPMFFIMEKISKELNLTDNQKAEVEKIREEIKAKMESKKQDRENNFTELENIFKQDKIDKESLKLLSQKHEQDREEMKEFMMDEFIKFHAILTPQQRIQAVEKFHEMKDKGRGFFHRDDKFPPKDREDKLPPNN